MSLICKMKNVQFTDTKLSIHGLVLLSLINSFSANSCNLGVGLQQELHNEGFHRNLTYKVMFQDKSKIIINEDCYVGLDQVLPAGVFVSPDELGDLMRMNKLTAIPKNRVNTELPAEESQPTSVFIIGQVNAGKVNLWLPVHARYHRATKGGGLYHNEIGQPRVFLQCPHRRLDDCEYKTQRTFLCSGHGKETCVWKEIPVTSVSETSIDFAVPVGDLDHYSIVAPATAAAVIVLSLYLLKTLHVYKLGIKRK